jgi:hypothetical protein
MRVAAIAGALLGSLVFMSPRMSLGEVKDDCIAAAEEADVLRRDVSKMLAARKKLQLCAAEECPGVVRTDCRTWLATLEEELPTVVFVAEDEEGRPILDIRVLANGTAVAEQLDGKPVPMDAGAHTFTFSAKGRPTMKVSVLLRPGQKNVEVAARYPADGRKGDGEPAAAEDARGRDAPNVLRPLSLGVLGLGVVGIGLGAFFGIRAASLQADANCPNNVCGADGKPDALRDAQASGNLSTGFFVTGGALAVGGLALFVLAPKPTMRMTVSPRITPSLAPGFAGVSFEAIGF